MRFSMGNVDNEHKIAVGVRSPTYSVSFETLDENAVEEGNNGADGPDGSLRCHGCAEKVKAGGTVWNVGVWRRENFSRPVDSPSSAHPSFTFPSKNMHHVRTRSLAAARRAAAVKPVLARGAHKEIKFSNEGRAAILAGVDILEKAVSVTLGPKGTYTSHPFSVHVLKNHSGRNVIIEQSFGGPKITKGV
jgi:hypothetical protein